MSSLKLLLVLLLALVCSTILASAEIQEAQEIPEIQEVQEEVSVVDSNTTEICTLGGLGNCNTNSAAGLRNQIAAELNRMGYSFVSVNAQWIRCSGCKMQGVAHDALVRATQSKNDYITLNSAWRASSDQYLLYKWYQSRMCGIQLAAKPGTSNHEGGLAIDTSYYSYWRSTLEAHGWRWFGNSDTVHFDFTRGGADLRSKNLQAFQRLWNRHNPSKRIGEDGIYGPATQNALANSPCNGW